MDQKTVLIVVAIILVLFFVYPKLTKEGFDAEETRQKEVSIKPLLYEKHTGVISAGSEFVGVPDVIIPPWGESDGLDDGAGGSMELQYNMCSKSCCSPQYPPAFGTDYDALVCKNKDQFVASGYRCNNSWQDSGCLCMTKKQRDFLSNRGGNNK